MASTTGNGHWEDFAALDVDVEQHPAQWGLVMLARLARTWNAPMRHLRR